MKPQSVAIGLIGQRVKGHVIQPTNHEAESVCGMGQFLLTMKDGCVSLKPANQVSNIFLHKMALKSGQKVCVKKM